MYEPYLALYLIAALAVFYLALKHFKLLPKAPIEQLAERASLIERAIVIMRGAKCPLCGGVTRVESATPLSSKTDDLSIILSCGNTPKCGQRSMWQLKDGYWWFTAPFKFSPFRLNNEESTAIPIEQRQETS